MEEDSSLSLHFEEVDVFDWDSDEEDIEEAGDVGGLSHEQADWLYSEAGAVEEDCEGENTTVTVLPQPFILLSMDEALIGEAKEMLHVSYDLADFQVQALLGKSYK